ncbi:hypothetical protein X975_05307, partial [Stegodyphus mimosarum]
MHSESPSHASSAFPDFYLTKRIQQTVSIWISFLFVATTCISNVQNTTLTVGYLANIHGKQRQGHIISGAMTYAIKNVNEQHVLPQNYSLKFVYQDTKGETLSGTNAVINMWRDGIIAFFGPENSCEVEATVSASLNL